MWRTTRNSFKSLFQILSFSFFLSLLMMNPAFAVKEDFFQKYNHASMTSEAFQQIVAEYKTSGNAALLPVILKNGFIVAITAETFQRMAAEFRKTGNETLFNELLDLAFPDDYGNNVDSGLAVGRSSALLNSRTDAEYYSNRARFLKSILPDTITASMAERFMKRFQRVIDSEFKDHRTGANHYTNYFANGTSVANDEFINQLKKIYKVKSHPAWEFADKNTDKKLTREFLNRCLDFYGMQTSLGNYSEIFLATFNDHPEWIMDHLNDLNTLTIYKKTLQALKETPEYRIASKAHAAIEAACALKMRSL